jgi:hypothetical protein
MCSAALYRRSAALLATLLLSCAALGADTTATEKAFLRDALQHLSQQATAFTDLDKRFAKIDLIGVLTPESITSRVGIETARAQVAQYRALLAERKALLHTYFGESEEFVRTRAPSEPARHQVMLAINTNKSRTLELYTALDASQSELAVRIAAVLDWSVSQLGKLRTQSGQIAFSTATQEAEFDRLERGVNEAVAKQNAVAQAASTRRMAAQARMREALAQAGPPATK